MKKKVLILTASIGSGHIKAAEAIDAEIKKLDSEVDIQTVDFMSCQVSIINWVLKKVYFTMLTFIPNFYDICYRIAGNIYSGRWLQNLLAYALLPSFGKMMRQYRPDMIVCTHPFPVGVASLWKSRNSASFFLAAVMTDYFVHQIWLYNGVSAYFVPTEEIRQKIASILGGLETTYAFGIPIKAGLDYMSTKEETRKELSLDNLPTILLMGGGLGLGNIEKTINALNNIPQTLQILVIVGKNIKLLLKIQLMAQKSHHKIHCWGYTDEVHNLMRASDLLITKPGALTISEALVLGLPMILHDPIPGPETENAVYTTHRGASIWLHNGESIADAVLELISKDLTDMKIKAKASGRATASIDIAKKLLVMLQQEVM